MANKRQSNSVWASLDWWTIAIYLMLLIFGWISVCGASYNYGDTEIFSMSTRSGMQIVWIATSIALGFVILMTDDRVFDTFAYIIYAALLLLPVCHNIQPTRNQRIALLAGIGPATTATR